MNAVIERSLGLARKGRSALVAEVQALARRGPLRPNVVLYESFAGNGALCNPEAIFREILRTPELTALCHVWVLDDLRSHERFRREFRRNPQVKFVQRRSLSYFRALATSGYLVNNATFPLEFSKRVGQIYLNTWHGTPLKLMGYDMPNGALESANTMKNFLSADFLLSQNPFMTERMYASAYRLRGAFRGRVLEEGYPRVDRQFLQAEGRAGAVAVLETGGIRIGDRRLVLYAPTWKGTSFSSPRDDAAALLASTRALQNALGVDSYLVVLKVHQAIHRLVAAQADTLSLLVSNDIPTNTVLGLADVLVTDYSSIFFDYLALDRPIIFLTPDARDYDDSRGTYFPAGELPGRSVTTVEETAAAVIGPSTAEELARRSRWRQDFTRDEDGGAARRVVDSVFRGLVPTRGPITLADSRRSLFLSIGGMRSNGITSSALNLLKAIDHEAYDVSVIFNGPRGEQQLANQAEIPPSVRQFHRVGGMNGSKLLHVRRRLAEYSPLFESRRDLASLDRMWKDEWRRNVGDCGFDSVVDFSGYTAFWASLLLHAPASMCSIWLHNDVVAETSRVIRGRRRMKRTLPSVFRLYEHFDSLVSVSSRLSRLNEHSLRARYPLRSTQFRSAANLVDQERVIAGLAQPIDAMLEESRPAGEVVETDWADAMRRDDRTRWFVTVGRFSYEKNQARLLRAFAEVYRQHQEIGLVLVGYGPLRDELASLIETLGLTGVAFLAGPFQNPFPVLALADCFVLSSDYEGQPMVLLEAAIAELPIVSVAFASVEDALPEQTIHIVQQSDRGLAEGMLAFLRGEVPRSSLDARAYNAMAVEQFIAATSP